MQRWLLIASNTLENVSREMIHHLSALNVWQAVFVIHIEVYNLKVLKPLCAIMRGIWISISMTAFSCVKLSIHRKEKSQIRFVIV